MRREGSVAASDEWHLVGTGQSEDDGSERSMPTQGGSRPQTPAVSLQFDPHALELGSECPPTPDSERLADTVLCAPFNTSGPSNESPRTIARPTNSSVDACGPEVVGVRCLQGLSQEGPLEGFALHRPASAASPGMDVDGPLGNCNSIHEATCEEAELCEDEVEGLQFFEGEEEQEEQEGWQGMDQVHLAGMDSLVELMEGLGWSGSLLVDAYRASVAGAQHALQRVTQTTVNHANVVRKTTQNKIIQLAAYMGKAKGSSSPATGLLVSALSLTTIATLAGLVYFMGRCRHLRMALEQKDREYARLVTRVLNLQAALSQSMSGPILRHTTGMLSSLVATTLM